MMGRRGCNDALVTALSLEPSNYEILFLLEHLMLQKQISNSCNNSYNIFKDLK